MSDRQRIFRMIETADNFIKYAPPGREEKASGRARKRLQRALTLARREGEDELVGQITLRIEDLERRASLPEGEGFDDDAGPAIAVAELPSHAAERVPPGQRVKRGWPVLHVGPIPSFDPATWRFTVRGAVDRIVELTYDELKALPNGEMRSDFHCVTGWSKLDNFWRGVKTKDLIALASPTSDAAHVLVHADHDYTANLPLDVLNEDESMVAWSHNGDDLAPKHGFPLRLIVPRLYAWKSVKWVRSFEVLTADRRGFWEVRGYHNRADPWLEERYSYQEK